MSRPSAHDDLIAFKTEDEFSKGWVSAPMDYESLPKESLVNKRFVIIQHGKPRVIDDCSASSLNSSVQKTESPKPQSTDMVTSLALSLLQRLHRCEVGVQAGACFRGWQYSYIAYHCPMSKSACVRQMYALPFGASRAVYGYLLIAHSLWFLLVKALSILTTYFFDDFVSLVESSEAALVDKSIHGFFSLLGWRVSTDKDTPFSEAFSALGTSVDFSRFSRGEVAAWKRFLSTL